MPHLTTAFAALAWLAVLAGCGKSDKAPPTGDPAAAPAGTPAAEPNALAALGGFRAPGAALAPAAAAAPAPASGAAASPAPGAATCQGACRKMADCKVAAYDDCLAACAGDGAPPELIAELQAATCESLHAWAAAQDGPDDDDLGDPFADDLGGPHAADDSAVPPARAAGTPAQSGRATCEQVCRKSEECEIIASYDACLPKCKANTPTQDYMDEWVSSTCDAIWSYSMQQAGAGGGDGNGCRSRGTNDCPSMTICCNGNAATGKPGQCISAPICYMPTR